MTRLLEMPDQREPLGRRDRAILELFYASGLRLSELVRLDVEDVNLSARIVRVMGKGAQGTAGAVQHQRAGRAARLVQGPRGAARDGALPERRPRPRAAARRRVDGASPCSSTSAARA